MDQEIKRSSVFCKDEMSKAQRIKMKPESTDLDRPVLSSRLYPDAHPMPSLNIAVPERTRWKLHYGSEQIKDVYIEEKLIDTERRHAAHQRTAELAASSTHKVRGIRSEITPAWILTIT